MIHNLSKFVRFLTKYNITAHEFMLPYMLYLDEKANINGIEKYPYDPDEGRPIAHLYQYARQSRGWSPDEIKLLEDKNLIKNNNRTVVEAGAPRRRTSPDMMEVTDEFRQQIFAPETRWEEFVQAYPISVPNFTSPDKPEIPLQMVSQPGAWEALEDFYNKVVRTKVLHEQILDIVEWGKNNGHINMNISKFVSSRHWETLKKFKSKKINSNDYGMKQY